VGLKTLDFYLRLLHRNSKVIVKHISLLIKEKHFKDKQSLEKGIEEDLRLREGVKSLFLDIGAAVHGFFYGFLVIAIASAVIGLIIYFGIVGYTMIF